MRRALAILFLVWAAASSAQAPQPKTEPANGQASQHVAAANQIAPVTRVEIVNQAGEPEGYQDPCRYDQSDSRSDLCAQWTAANGARDAAYYARLQLWAAVAGMAGLVATVILTLLALKASRKAVRVAENTAERQLRAYIDVSDAKIKVLDNGDVHVCVSTTNFGQTPASAVSVWANVILEKGPLDSMPVASRLNHDNGTVPPGHPRQYLVNIPGPDYARIGTDGLTAFIPVRIEYTFLDGAGTDTFETCLVIKELQKKSGHAALIAHFDLKGGAKEESQLPH